MVARVHPKHCPRCRRPWELESQLNHRCQYCSWKLTWKENRIGPNLKAIFRMLLPVMLWVLFGLFITITVGVKLS